MEGFPSGGAVMTTLLLSSARMVGIMLIFPLFTMANVTGVMAFAIGSAFSAPFIMRIFSEFTLAPPAGGIMLGLLTLKELGLGFAIGALLSYPFFAIQTAGDLIDHSRSATIGNVVDPVNSSETTTTGTYFLIIALFSYASHGGVQDLLEAIYGTYKAWPIEAFVPPADINLPLGAGQFLTAFLKMGFLIATPFLLVYLAVDLTIFLLGRMAGRLSIFDLSNTFKNLLTVLLMPLFMLFLPKYLVAAISAMEQFWSLAVIPIGK